MREFKFKVGDKVLVSQNQSGSINLVGSIGIIECVNKSSYDVSVDGVRGGGNSHIESDLILIEEKALTGIELTMSDLLKIDLDISYFYNIEITEGGIRLQGHIGSDVVRDLIKLGYEPETTTSSNLRFRKDSVVVVLT